MNLIYVAYGIFIITIVAQAFYMGHLLKKIADLTESESKWRNEATRLNNELGASRKVELMLRNRFKIN